MNRRTFFGVGVGVVTGLAGQVRADVAAIVPAPTFREYSPQGKIFLAERNRLASVANRHSEVGEIAEYNAAVVEMKAVESQLVVMENPR